MVFLDLGSEQLAESSAESVSTVLYWKVLQYAGYSKDKKLAQLELTLHKRGKLDEFLRRYRERFNEDWYDIHNDPLVGNARAAHIVPAVMPQDFPTPESYSKLRFELADNLRDRAQEMIDLVRNKTGKQNVLFLIDEVGQYVAPRGELILNLDGLVRVFKELSRGKVWVIATGQQTLSEIVTKAQYNSGELNKLRDRFPISIELDARDIKEITYRRLLTKRPEGEVQLKSLFKTSGQAMIAHTRLAGTSLYRSDPDADSFAQFYPFLPQHFDLLLELIRSLARGGLGLRSVIKVIQDVLVDVNRLLPPDTVKLADRPIGALACVDDFYDTLRADILKTLPHVVAAVDLTTRLFGSKSMPVRVGKAAAALQNIEEFPSSAENIAALLYPAVDAPGLLPEVREALKQMLAEKEIGLIEDPKVGGYVFLSASVQPLQKKRSEMTVTAGDTTRVRNEILQHRLFDPQPAARLENTRDVKAAVRSGKHQIVGDGEDITFRLEWVDDIRWETRRTELLTETAAQNDWRTAIAWLARTNYTVEELLPEIVKSDEITKYIDERTADRDAAQYLRAELKSAETHRDEVEKLLRQALLSGTLIFRGRPTPVGSLGETIDAAARAMLGKVAKEVFDYYRLAPIRANTDLAAKFLSVERLDRLPGDLDPLRLVVKQGGTTGIDLNQPALAETLRAFSTRLEETGGGRLQGNAIQDFFASPPYGWSKDTVRYLFAALLMAGAVEFHTAEGALKVAGPKAAEACKSTVAFNKAGVSLRDAPLDPETLDRAARRLEELFGDEVLPLEEHISRSARRHLPEALELASSLPDRLRLLSLAGEARARNLIAALNSALSGDATGAAPTFGAKETALPEDIRWARNVSKAFENGAEDEVRAANVMRGALAEMRMLFPDEDRRLLPVAEDEALGEVLASERFFERLADVRATTRSVRERAQARYAELRSQMEESLQTIAAAIEAHLDWPLIGDEDRSDIMRKLQATLPLQATGKDPIGELKVLLLRRSGLPGLQNQLEVEIARRVPQVVIDELAEPEVEQVSFASLQPPTMITTEAELDEWLKQLRAKLSAMLRARKHIRFGE